MKKMMIFIAGLFSTTFIFAMDIMKLGNKEKNYFQEHLSAKVAFGKRIIQENRITEKNALHVIHCNLLDQLTLCNGDLFTIISQDDDLREDVNYYAEVIGSDDYMQSLWHKVVKGDKDDPETIATKKELVQLRCGYAQEFVEHFQQEYCILDVNNNDIEHEIDFMIKNAHYPLDQEAQRRYIVSFIYQNVLARRMPFEWEKDYWGEVSTADIREMQSI